jgi:peroxiredoxin
MGSMTSLPDGVAASADQTHPLGVGAALPPNLRPETINGKPFDLNKAVRSKPTVLIFYRGGWCPFCNIQMGQLAELEPQLKALGYQILAISADNPAHLKESVAKHQLTYTLLSDTDMAAAKAFGLAWHVDDTTYAQMKNHGVDLEAASGRTDHILPVPAAYVLDRKGVIKFAYANPDFKVRVNPDDLLKAAQAAL